MKNQLSVTYNSSMIPGDLLIVVPNARSYAVRLRASEAPFLWPKGTFAIFLGSMPVSHYEPRAFYIAVTPLGVHQIYPGFCKKV